MNRITHGPKLRIDIERYGGKQVAILDGKVVASGRTLAEVAKRARQKAPKRRLGDFRFLVVPETLHTIYFCYGE